MAIDLYTLPTCPICEMVKTKLKNKNIYFEEHPLEECTFIDTDRAPVMVIGHEVNLSTDPISADVDIILSPKQMTDWINQQE